MSIIIHKRFYFSFYIFITFSLSFIILACKIVALFFADDGKILMQSLRETKESIRVLMNIAEECGININKDKSNIMIFNHKEKIHEDNIEGIQITDTINYLGVTIQNKRDCFKKHTIKQMNKARRYANLMPAVIAKSCNKLLIGKTYWKSAALPAILHGSEVRKCVTLKTR